MVVGVVGLANPSNTFLYFQVTMSKKMMIGDSRVPLDVFPSLPLMPLLQSYKHRIYLSAAW
ncbi:hypothetical protein F383_13307 [Gossypium arboreum]|uniref:Uncharacterized protein n=1 Tax=Gossypium arboreum TaxID=29729 RepID=A0A0B0PSV1_GOSAR|nr:hypothetical protein F383_13307 [Gossypium arboreum]